MKIFLSPVRSNEDQPTIFKSADSLNINGEDFDFSGVTDGSTLPGDAIYSEWIIGDVVRESGEIVLTIKLPHGVNATESTRFPEPLLNVQDGQVELPS